ncbi:MAG: tetratricopeptide repeat protein [Vampirovibrio sp.]|nr:tetratricopeptide repeat protein [Vampirovibrio sp.]
MSKKSTKKLSQAIQLHQSGHLEDAKQLYRQILSVNKNQVDALNLLGTILCDEGDPQQAEGLLTRALTLNPKQPELHFSMANILRDAGKLIEAKDAYQRAIQLDRTYLDAYINLGNVLQALRELDDAIAVYQKAISICPNTPDLYNNLGNVYKHQGEPTKALDCFNTCLKLDPGHANAYFNAGGAFQDMGNTDLTVMHYEMALQLKPDFPQVYMAYGQMHLAKQDYQKSIAAFEKALEHSSQKGDIYKRLGDIYFRTSNFDKAEEAFKNAVESGEVDQSYCYAWIAYVQERQSKTREAIENFNKAYELSPNNLGLKVRAVTRVPVVYSSLEEIEDYRTQMVQALEDILAEAPVLDNPYHQFGGTNFFLAYQGKNDRSVMELMNRIFNPNVLEAPIDRTRLVGEKPRIGIVSRNLRKSHTIGKLMIPFLDRLDRDKFSVVLYRMQEFQACKQDFYEGQPDKGDVVVEVSLGDYHTALEKLCEIESDILLYTDIGMDPMSYFLAMAKPAKIQCVTWGHPVTTGLDRMDYFLSSKLLEPENAQTHYTEELILLDTLPTYYEKPQPTESNPDKPPKSRMLFGLPKDKTIYLCPQSVFKIHPEFDSVLADILRKDPNGVLVMVKLRDPGTTEVLQARLERNLPDVYDRIFFLNPMPREDFVQLMAISDVMLDPLHFGGGNTTYEGFSTGLPIVTLPGDYMRGRVTYACYQQMGLTDCVANNKDHYVEIALRLGTDKGYRQQVSDKIIAGHPDIFENTTFVQELEAFFMKALTSYLPE